ncbi:MAG: excinuclease ABC subunit UvrC [Alphaproteobacteria bacterium]|nr:excinuclease ABC subunit UvrC [Alphaproteobacteria bacterium]
MSEDPPTPSPAPGSALPPAGADVIAGVVRTLPSAPGVYRMLDGNGDVLYVGKARDLKKRVLAYTKLGGHTNRIAAMIAQTASMEIVRTHTEMEALLLEANLIKRLKPRYNIILRDDKSFPYILLTGDHPFAQVVKHRGARSRPGRYFGPFASANAVNRTLNTLQRVFLLRSCSDAVFESRTRPCLLYQIRRCSAPCTGEIDAEGYGRLLAEAESFLAGENKSLQDRLSAEMEAAAEALDFETAASLRDRIRALTAVQAHQGINPSTVTEADVIAAHAEAGQVCVQVFFFRAGQNWGNRAFFPRHEKEAGEAEVLEAFIAQFYDDKPVPRLILLSHALPEQALVGGALGLKAGGKVELQTPARGEKRALVEHALANAREALGRRLSETASQTRLLEGLAEAFGLPAPPRRIEVYDNSHIQGTNALGAMIVAGPEGFEKASYRTFNIRTPDLAPGDDYGMMREVLTRRLRRLAAQSGDDPQAEDPARPDLLLIDGGQGQLNAARAVLDELGLDIPLVAIAKGPDRNAGRETFFQPGRASFLLPPGSPVLYYLQRLRDEAHRFAIGSHRARRSKAIAASPLDEIAGIGARRKRALLNHFGSARAVQRAGLADLEAVDGISRAIARKVYEHFHGED